MKKILLLGMLSVCLLRAAHEGTPPKCAEIYNIEPVEHDGGIDEQDILLDEIYDALREEPEQKKMSYTKMFALLLGSKLFFYYIKVKNYLTRLTTRKA
jgi:hypothetical protein